MSTLLHHLVTRKDVSYRISYTRSEEFCKRSYAEISGFR